MDEKRTEELLRRYARAHPEPSPVSPEVERRVRDELSSMARSEERGRRWRRLLGGGLGLAAAALAVFALARGLGEPAPDSRRARGSPGDVAARMELVDRNARPLVRMLKGAPEPAELPAVQGEFFVEVTVSAPARLRLFAYDASGVRHAVAAGEGSDGSLEARPGTPVYLDPIARSDLAPPNGTPTWIGLLLLSSDNPIEASALDEVVPGVLEAGDLNERLERVAAAARARLGCEARHLALTYRGR